MTDKVPGDTIAAPGAGGSIGPENKLATIGATLPPGIWILDLEGNLFSGSQMAIAELRALSGEAIANGWREVHRRSDDGSTITMLSTSAPLLNSKGEVAANLAINLDITEKKRTEDELRRRSEELLRSNANLQQFAYVASHDLQEPLRAVSGYLELLRERNRGILDEESNRFIDSSVSAALRMSEMINGLLAYSRVNTVVRPFLLADSGAALGKALENLKASIDESHAEISADELPTLVADEMQMVTLFQNLVSNAIKYRGSAVPRIQISAKSSANEWVFSVKDNGIGIDPMDHERIFAMFQRVRPKDKTPGTGMGLSICKAIVQRHRGRIWVESESGQGATFHFTIATSMNPVR